jgi:hypothetical protein
MLRKRTWGEGSDARINLARSESLHGGSFCSGLCAHGR